MAVLASATDNGVNDGITMPMARAEAFGFLNIDVLYRIDGMLYPYIAPGCITTAHDWLTRMREQISGTVHDDTQGVQ